MTCPQQLREAIEGLYVAFSDYPLPEDTMPCGCCHSSKANDLLHAVFLRELQWEHLSDYSTDALLVWGDLDCYKHFLPRIFELVLTSGDWTKDTPTPEMVFMRLSYGKWRTWPETEQAAIEKMLYAIWETILGNPPIEGGYIDVDQWICCISQCEDDISSYLQTWANDDRISASWALSSFILGTDIVYSDTEFDPPVCEGEESQAKIEEWFNQPHPGAFWSRNRKQYVQLQQWVKSPAAVEKLRRAEISCGRSDLEGELRDAQQCILEAKKTKFERVYKQRRFQTVYWESPTYRLY